MHTVAAIGFGLPDSLRLLDALRSRDRALKLVELRAGEIAAASKSGAGTALIWGGGPEGAHVAALAAEATRAGLAVVALLPRFDLLGIDPASGHVEICFPPLTPEEVALRLTLVRKRAAGPPGANLIQRGDLSLDIDRYEVSLAGEKVDLTFKEYELLKYLASNPGRVFTREALLRSVWEYDYFGGTRTVDVHVRRLRSKIDDMRHRFIETVWNVGYRFRADDDGPAQPGAGPTPPTG